MIILLLTVRFLISNSRYLAPIFWVYTAASITKTFFITAGTFGAMTIFGYTTKQDLSRFGAILNMVLIGLVIAIVVNIFAHSSTLDWIISIVGVFVFVGLTAWDTQQIKTMAAYFPADQVGRLATIGALNLYLDFINLFLFLLRFFGNSRD
ncbi:MAG: Bax inhibitor-1/YccA family protein [Muribaculaceae bacterium]|nr:Bax inhibitor-1/YccA family protein [Muribaculaceae bacterium]